MLEKLKRSLTSATVIVRTAVPGALKKVTPEQFWLIPPNALRVFFTVCRESRPFGPFEATNPYQEQTFCQKIFTLMILESRAQEKLKISIN